MTAEVIFYLLCFLLGFFSFGFYLRSKRIRQERELLALLDMLQKHQMDELYGRTSALNETEDNRE